MTRALKRYGESGDGTDRICTVCNENLTKRHGVMYPTVHCDSQGAGYGVQRFSCKPRGVNPEPCHVEHIHHGKRAVNCPFCHAYLGCSWCLPVGDSICTRCNKDTRGNRMLSREEAREAAKLLRMVLVDRTLTPDDAVELFRFSKRAEEVPAPQAADESRLERIEEQRQRLMAQAEELGLQEERE